MVIIYLFVLSIIKWVIFLAYKKIISLIKEKADKKILEKVPAAESMADILGEDKNGNLNPTSVLTYILPLLYGRLFGNSPDKVLSKQSIKVRQKFISNSLRKATKLILTKELLIDKKIEPPEDTPVIYASTHGFLEDSITMSLITKRSAYYLVGSMPMALNGIFGLLLYINGSIYLNRRNKESKKASVEKAVRALELGTNLFFYPEGVWNKTANQLTLRFWSGIVKVAHKSKAPIVPIIQIPVHNKIYISQLEPFYVSKYKEAELLDALDDLQTVFNTELWRLMEKYATTTREELLGNYNTSAEMYEEHLKNVVEASGTYYDYPIETSSDYRDKNVVRPEDVWEPIAKLEITSQNAKHVVYARKLVDRLKKEDYQRRF